MTVTTKLKSQSPAFASILLLAAAIAAAASCTDKKEDCEARGDCNAAAGSSGLGGVSTGGQSSQETGGANGGTAASTAGAGEGGGLAGAGMAGAAGTPQLPCSGTCGASTPICDTSTNVCVACQKDSECAAPTPACAGSKACVQCTSGAYCPASKPVCRLESNTCVECVTSSDCAAIPGKPVCDLSNDTCVGCVVNTDCAATPATPYCGSTKTCVGCIDDTQCPSAYLSHCEPTTNSCSPCTVDADCSHIAGKTACSAGTCVKCSVSNETACIKEGFEYSCDPKTNECTNTKKNSIPLCGACVADSECATGTGISVARCVPMVFGPEHTAHGSYCLEAESSGCDRPFGTTAVTAITAVSASGAASARYCGINQELVTCEAIRDMQDGTGNIRCVNSVSQLPDDTLCGCQRKSDGLCSTRGQGGLCRSISGTYLCTVQCGEGRECTTGRACISTDVPNYCG